MTDPELKRVLKKLCVIVPVFNQGANIPLLYEELVTVLGNSHWDLEIIFVNDGSTDGTAAICRKLHKEDLRIQYITLSRNFGHQKALTAGLDMASGDGVVLLDADLQDPPEVILKMIQLWEEEGFDVVFGQRKYRGDEGFIEKMTAKIFYRVLADLSGIRIPANSCDFRLMDMRIVEKTRVLREQSRFIRGLVSWLGYNQTSLFYDRRPQSGRKGRYPLIRKIRFAWDGIATFSAMPLRLATLFGAVLSLMALGFAAYYFTVVIRQSYNGDFETD